MERESAVPDAKELERVAEVVARLVDGGIDEPGADEHPRDEIPDQRVEVALGHRDQPAPDPPAREPVADDVPDEVHHAVPADRERPDPHELRRDSRIGDGHPSSARTRPR